MSTSTSNAGAHRYERPYWEWRNRALTFDEAARQIYDDGLAPAQVHQLLTAPQSPVARAYEAWAEQARLRADVDDTTE